MEMTSPYIIAVIIAWLVAQSAKYLLMVVKHHNFDHIRQIYLSGNMPSAHSATVAALAVMVGLHDGFESGIFALTALFAAIVMYDAVMVRRSSGEQGQAIQELIKEQKSKVFLPRAAKGHTPLEVAVGALTGIVIATIVFLATK